MRYLTADKFNHYFVIFGFSFEFISFEYISELKPKLKTQTHYFSILNKMNYNSNLVFEFEFERI